MGKIAKPLSFLIAVICSNHAEDWISKPSNTIVHIRLSVRFIDYGIKGAMTELYIFLLKKKVNASCYPQSA
jgi:hypothetical protein